MSPQLHALPIFDDNYIWLLQQGDAVLAVDPGEAQTLIGWLQQRPACQLDAILITHRHYDHVDGLPELRVRYPQTPVYGPAGVKGVTHPLADGDTLDLPQGRCQVLATPGHTREHLSYHLAPYLFCGDTLFSAGCGRLLDGPLIDEFAASLARIAALPDETLLCCTHEYTQSNLRFAQAVEPDNPLITERIRQVVKLRAEGRPSLPVPLEMERGYNPYLRLNQASVQASALAAGARNRDRAAIFQALRAWKDVFR